MEVKMVRMTLELNETDKAALDRIRKTLGRVPAADAIRRAIRKMDEDLHERRPLPLRGD